MEEVMAIVFLDLDGTILDQGKPAKDVLLAISKLKERGHTPVIATGRTPHLLYGMEKTLGIDSYIAANGSYICYHGNVVLADYIQADTVSRMVKFCEHKQIDLVFESQDDYVALSKRTHLVDLFSDIFEIERPRIEPDYYQNHDLLAMIFFADEYIEEARQNFPELIFNRSNRFGYDVNNAGDLKAGGVRWLVQYLNIAEDDVYAIGDGYNDISMLSYAKHGIAMGNAYPETKAVASYITSSVHEGGVYQALQHFKLIE